MAFKLKLPIALLNVAYAAFGALLSLGFMVTGYKLFDKMPPFDTSKELSENNTAVGLVIGSIFIGLGIAIGLVVGLGLN